MRKIFLLLVSLLLSAIVSAQITTASLEGTVTDSNGLPLVGAAVIAVDSATGSSFGAASNSQGHYHIQGLRPGVYDIDVSFVGYVPHRRSAVPLSVGEPEEIDFRLESQNEMEEIVVSASNTKRFRMDMGGASGLFTGETVDRVPTVSRSIGDIAALSPQVVQVRGGGLSVAGMSKKYNSFLIDGVSAGDIMGMSAAGTVGGQVTDNPIPLESVDQIMVSVAPYDVRHGSFTGGGINVITKAGDNTLSGAVYSYYSNQDFYGRTAGNASAPVSSQYSRTFGVALGGPVIRDRLFYYVNLESVKDSYPSTFYPGYPGGLLGEGDVAAVSERYKALTGYDGGGWDRKDVDTRNLSLLARVDWNMSERSRLTFRYSLLDVRKDMYASTAYDYYLNGAFYDQTNRTHSAVAELNSRLTGRLHNELRIGFNSSADGRSSDTSLPAVTVRNLGSTLNTSVNIGTNAYILADGVFNDWTLTDNVTLFLGRHSFTAGAHADLYGIRNRFIANSNGSYVYNSLEDFLEDRASSYMYGYTDESITGSPTWTPKIRALQYGVYLQDRFRPTDRLTLTAGVRVDVADVLYRPSVNSAFNSSEIAQRSGALTGDLPRPRAVLSPRLGFSWYADSARRTLVRGGAGLFTGQSPFVWITNTFTNNGVELKSQTLLSDVPPFSSVPTVVPSSTANPSINVIDRNYRYPKVLRADLAVEHEADGWRFSLEGIVTRTLDNVRFTNLTARDTGARLMMAGSALACESNTAVYYSSDISRYSSVYLIDNTSRGYSYSVTASAGRNFLADRLRADISYTFSHSLSVSDAPSSQASSNWSKNYAVNSNSPELSYSIYDIPHRIVLLASYVSDYSPVWRTTLTLTAVANSGQRHSYTYSESVDLNGDTAKGNTLLYIPTEREMEAMSFSDIVSGGKVTDASEQREMMENWILSDRYLRSNRGSFSERNAFSTPFENHVNLSVTQSFMYDRVQSRRVELRLDIMNVANLLCRSWGTEYSLPGNWTLTPVTVTGVSLDADGNATPTYQFKGASPVKDYLRSRYHAQIGLRVTF